MSRNTTKTIKELTYKCSDANDKRCTNQQTIRYGVDEAPLPVTNCVPCGAGYGMTIAQQMQGRVGMFPVGAPVLSN